MIQQNLPFFFSENCENSSFIILSQEESRHAIKSLRLKKDDCVIITNGKGYIFEAVIINPNFNNVEVKVISEYKINHMPYYLHVACAITQQSERFEWFVEKAIEFGISEITPIVTKRTEKKSIKIERLQKIAISAIKQSRQAYLPKINPVADFKNFVENTHIANKAIAACSGNRLQIKQWIQNNTTNEYLVIIGPEGDFTDEETQLAIKNNFTLLNLGNSILRSETAAIYISSIFRVLKL